MYASELFFCFAGVLNFPTEESNTWNQYTFNYDSERKTPDLEVLTISPATFWYIIGPSGVEDFMFLTSFSSIQ